MRKTSILIAKLIDLPLFRAGIKCTNINDDGAMAIFNVACGDVEKIKEKYSIISKMKTVNNLTGAMIQAIKEDWTTNSINNNTFNNFEAREYDYDSLEKKLLGWE